MSPLVSLLLHQSAQSTIITQETYTRKNMARPELHQAQLALALELQSLLL